MSLITISRGSRYKGREVAEKVAERLGYECISREILLEASEEFNLPEIKLKRALHDAPSILDRFTFGKEKYTAYVRAALLEHFQKGNIIYHGLAGHFFVKGVSHVLKVRILCDMEERVRIVMKSEGISEKKALQRIRKYDEERRKWSLNLYGIDTHDSSLYDLVIHIHKITADDAADIICHTAAQDHFQVTPESQQAFDDLLLSAQIHALLMALSPHTSVTAKNGHVLVKCKAPLAQLEHMESKIKKIVGEFQNVEDVKVKLSPLSSYEIK